MNRLTGLAVFATFVAFQPAAAQAQWYVGLDGGVDFLRDADIGGREADGTPITDKSASHAGYALLMQGGYDFGGPKAEIELGWRSAGLKTLDGHDSKYGGSTSSLSLMANGLYEFLPKSSWHPFLGAGLGAARTSVRWKNDEGIFLKDADWVFAYQAIAGVSYDLNRNWALKAQYRYFGTLDPSYTSTSGDVGEVGYASHSILAGVTYKFGK